MNTGAWLHKCDCVCLEPFSLEAALECCGPAPTALTSDEKARRYAGFMHEAHRLAGELAGEAACPDLVLDSELETLKFFSVPQVSVADSEADPAPGDTTAKARAG